MFLNDPLDLEGSLNLLTMPCSTTAVQEAVNFEVASSNLAGAVTDWRRPCSHLQEKKELETQPM